MARYALISDIHANLPALQAVLAHVDAAPAIAGMGIANPLALLMSATMMLTHLADQHDDAGCRDVATQIKLAYDRALQDGQRTRDLGGELDTEAFTQAVIERLSG